MKYDITVQGHHPLINLISLQCEQRRGWIDGAGHVSLIGSKTTQIEKQTRFCFSNQEDTSEYLPCNVDGGSGKKKKVLPGFYTETYESLTDS